MRPRYHLRSRLISACLALVSALLLTGRGQSLAAQTTYTPYHFVTIAGTAGAGGHINATGPAAQFASPDGIAVDSSGNIYVADSASDTIRQITPGGVVTTIAGSAGVAGGVDGPGTTAQLHFPTGLAVDRNGNLYVADTQTGVIRKITPTVVSGVTTWTVTTLTATISNTSGYLVWPIGVSVDPSGNLFYTTVDRLIPNSIIVEFSSGAGGVEDIAGSAASGGFVNGTGSFALFNNAVGIAVDANDNLYVADAGNNDIRKITLTTGGLGLATILAGYSAGSADGTQLSASFNQPKGVAVDSNGNVYVADAGNDTIRKISPAGVSTTLGGVPGVAGSADGTGAGALFNQPAGITVDANGNVYVTDTGNNTIREGSPPAVAPVLTLQPVSATIATGRSAALSVAATGSPAPTFQWSLNGTAIAGATDPILEVKAATSANAGTYTCTATNSVGAATSSSATLTVTTSSTPGYLVNISARADVGTGNNILIGGFGISGSGAKQLLLRGVGPGLFDTFSLTGQLVNPQLTLVDNSSALVASNIGWANSPTLGPSAASESPGAAGGSIMATVGAFAYNAGSADTALLITAPPGNNTAQVSGVGSTSGIALCEIYDADATPTAHLINISARADVGTGNNILIGGFAIGGSTAETVLIRAVGPGLTDVFGLTGTLAQPVLTLFDNHSAVIYSNTVWGGDATIAGVFPTVGAFNLNLTHADSVLLVTLPPGNYTAQVTGVSGGTGIALCEIYEVP